ncbi:MAG: GHKL domain-containing protein, partial [Clostridia bacterium]|nr:GHKL domain-containing protein [Clostridia bacterium]
THGKITVNLRTVSDKTVIVCSNPCKPGLIIENGMIKQKGIGMESMLKAAKKYNGDISYSIKNGILTLCVILKT